MRLGLAAVELHRLRELQAMADRARQRQLCRRAEVRGFMRETGEPCWKQRRDVSSTPFDGPELVQTPRSTWCESCRRRQAAHDRYRELGRQVAGARRRLSIMGRTYRSRYGEVDLEGATEVMFNAILGYEVLR